MSARAAVLTISTSLANGEGEDVSGPALVRLCEQAGLEVQHELVAEPDLLRLAGALLFLLAVFLGATAVATPELLERDEDG